jgi:hypothetical protein
MNNDEAKFVLSAYRPSGGDAADPQMGQALEQAKRDPVLGAAFARQQGYDAAVAAKISAIAPPAGLREAILAGARASARPSRAMRNRRRPLWLGLAASVVILLGMAAWWRYAPIRGASLDDFALNYVHHGFVLQKRSADVAALKAWLGDRNRPVPETLPTEFAALRALGCRTLTFQGQEISLVCFERNGHEFHVFVARRDGAGDDLPPATSPRFIDRGQLAAASWADARQRYVVVSDAGMVGLKQVL